MSQVNVTPPSDSGDRTAAAGINMITVLIVLVVVALLAWFLFTGPLRGTFGGGTNININPPAQQQEQPQQPQQQPQQPQPPQPQP